MLIAALPVGASAAKPGPRTAAAPRVAQQPTTADAALDPLADPEELEQQAAALRDSEGELGREVERLERQATRFERIAIVRKQHDRASELDLRDDVDPRRVAVRSSAADTSHDSGA